MLKDNWLIFDDKLWENTLNIYICNLFYIFLHSIGIFLWFSILNSKNSFTSVLVSMETVDFKWKIICASYRKTTFCFISWFNSNEGRRTILYMLFKSLVDQRGKANGAKYLKGFRTGLLKMCHFPLCIILSWSWRQLRPCRFRRE